MFLPRLVRSLPLAYKCLVLFGGAAALIVLISSALPLVRMNALVDEGNLSTTRELLNAYIRSANTQPALIAEPEPFGDGTVLILPLSAISEGDDSFKQRAKRWFSQGGPETIDEGRWDGTGRRYRVAQLLRVLAPGDTPPGPGTEARILIVERRSDNAALLLLVNGLYVLAAGAAVLAVGLGVLFWITNRLILRPVEALKFAAEQVRDGQLDTPIEVTTGDEFQELAETLSLMLAGLRRQQKQLRAINSAMDLKLNELAEANAALYESARVKGEFLANVSHELRTPLNSIIGFADLLQEIAKRDLASLSSDTQPPKDLVKRERYLGTILNAGRNLLALIESLLEMAKIEAGRVDLRVEDVNLRETCDGLLGLVQPLADSRRIELRSEVPDSLPIVRTDPKKVHQVMFNLLSNAVKFAPDGPTDTPIVTLRAERLEVIDDTSPERVRLSVIDNGPGIAPEDHARIFEQFERLGDTRTSRHEGTGLGLAICKELATILDGEIQVVSDLRQGAMFSLIIPTEIDPDHLEEHRLERQFRGVLAGKRLWVE